LAARVGPSDDSARMPVRPKKPQRPENADIVVVGVREHPLRDIYHAALRASWLTTLVAIVLVFLASNVLFALAYLETGGIAHAETGSFVDAFYFSVQTMGTIGYGAMYPETHLANALVVAEAVYGLLITAVSTGLVFAKFSRPTSRLVFSTDATISPMNGVPTLAFRVGNERGNTILEAVIRVAALRTERTEEGILFYRMYDLTLVRDRSPALSRSWNVLHTIDEKSPLYGVTPESAARDELEVIATVVGTDDTSLQPVHGRHRYVTEDIVWGARLSDALTELKDGRIQLDVTKFHEIEPTAPSAAFPYRWEETGAITEAAAQDPRDAR
jgi:inward rectifier potassium channel